MVTKAILSSSSSSSSSVLVRSLSQRTNAWIPLRYRLKNGIFPAATTETSSHVTMIPLVRTLVTSSEGIATQRQLQSPISSHSGSNEVKKQLTRTMVHRMRINDLKEELVRRGLRNTLLNNGSGSTSLKRPDLIHLLLSEISSSPSSSSSFSSSPVSDVTPSLSSVKKVTPTTHDPDRFTNITNEDDDDDDDNSIDSTTTVTTTTTETIVTDTNNDSETVVESTTGSKSLSSTTTSSIDDLSSYLKQVGDWSVQQYPIDEIQFDSQNTTYSITPVGVTLYGKSGKGIGIVMRECNTNTIVWQAQKYYKGYRSIFECNYCALIVALRFALEFFHLQHIQIHLPNLILLNQIMGHLPITKPTLQLLMGQVTQILKHQQSNNNTTEDGLVFQLADREHRLLASALAQDALKTKKSYNMDSYSDQQQQDILRRITIDPMLDFGFHADAKRELSWKVPNPVEDNTITTPQLKYQTTIKPEDVIINPAMTYKLRFDGGSRGNPGVAGAGMVLYDDKNHEIWRGVKYLGRTMSNNLAEYSALNIGLSYALSMGIENICCEGDSQLVVKQLNGTYKVKSDNLRDLFHETQILIQKFKSCQVHHIRREFNSRADELANQAMSTKSDFGLDNEMVA